MCQHWQDIFFSTQVRVVASLPCYSTKNVEEQRGGGVFDRSIEGLQALNAAGYGRDGSGLILDLVYNPNGVFLAPPQEQLQVVPPLSHPYHTLLRNFSYPASQFLTWGHLDGNHDSVLRDSNLFWCSRAYTAISSTLSVV